MTVSCTRKESCSPVCDTGYLSNPNLVLESQRITRELMVFSLLSNAKDVGSNTSGGMPQKQQDDIVRERDDKQKNNKSFLLPFSFV